MPGDADPRWWVIGSVFLTTVYWFLFPEQNPLMGVQGILEKNGGEVRIETDRDSKIWLFPPQLSVLDRLSIGFTQSINAVPTNNGFLVGGVWQNAWVCVLPNSQFSVW